MNNSMASQLTDSDMQSAPQALLRAAQRARDVARQTNTPLVLVRDGVLVEEYVADAVAKGDDGHLRAPVQPAV
jgi:hypothetical protein